MLISTYVSVGLIVLASLLFGRAILLALGRPEPNPMEPAVGLAALITIGFLGVRVPGRATTTLVVLVVLLIAAFLYLGGRRERPHGSILGGAAVAALTLLFASIPFIAAGHIGVLGIGVNNDLAMHLDLAAWVDDPIGVSPTEFKTGYPLGPHGVVAAIATGIGAEPLAPFLGLTLALPVLTSISAYQLLRDLQPIPRAAASILTALPYLAASTLGVGGFKETLMALLVFGLALALRELTVGEGNRRGILIAIGVLAAGMLAVYSYPGIGYAAAIIGTWGVVEFVLAARRGEAERTVAIIRRAAPFALIPVGALVVIGILEQERIREFTESVDIVFEASSRLKETVSPFETLAIWPSGDYLEGTSGLSAYLVFGVIGLIGLAIGLAFAFRRDERALLATLAAGLLIYAFTLIAGGLYVQAKSLVIISPLVAALVLWALLRDPAPLKTAFAVAFIALGAYSSFMALRDSRVAPDAYGSAQLGEFRETIRGKTVLSLTNDRFSDYYLRGSDVFGPGRFSEEQIVARAGKLERFPVDFDSVVPGALDRFDYAITTRAAYKSAPPPNFAVAAETDDFVLWKRNGRTPLVGVLPEEERPGSVLDCSRPKLQEILARAKREGYTTAVVQPISVVGKRLEWEPGSTLESGESISQTLKLPKGRWQISLQYYSPVMDLEVTGPPGLASDLPPTADGGFKFRTDQGPFWPVGEVISDGAAQRLTIHASGLSGLQKLLGVDQIAEIGNLTASQPDRAREVPLARACGLYVDHYFANRVAAKAQSAPAAP